MAFYTGVEIECGSRVYRRCNERHRGFVRNLVFVSGTNNLLAVFVKWDNGWLEECDPDDVCRLVDN